MPSTQNYSDAISPRDRMPVPRDGDPGDVNLLKLSKPHGAVARDHSVKADSSAEHLPSVSIVDKGATEQIYKQWFEGVSKGTVSYYAQLELANQYLLKSGRPESVNEAQRQRYVERWIKEQNERPRVELSLHSYLSAGTRPSAEEIGLMVGKALGYSQAEMWMFAVSAKPPFKSPGAAFFDPQGNDEKVIDQLLAQARLDMAGLGRVAIPEAVRGSIQIRRDWIEAEHKRHTPILKMEEIPRSFLMGVFVNVYNPIANGLGSAAGTLGDIVQGAGLPLHLLSHRTFLDGLADNLRRTGRELPLNGLYTKEEMNDVGIMLLNFYTAGVGGALPYMATGGLSKIASMTPRTAALAAQLVGMAGNSGQVYDTVLGIQARTLAVEEAGKKGQALDAASLERRVQEIKEGKNISLEQREHMDRQALLTAALTIPVGYLQGKLLPELGESLIAGQSIDSISSEAFAELKMSLKLGDLSAAANSSAVIAGAFTKQIFTGALKGGALSFVQLSGTEMAMAITAVQTPKQAWENILTKAPDAALQGSMLFASGQVLKLRYGGGERSTADLKGEGGTGSLSFKPKFDEIGNNLTPTIESVTVEKRNLTRAKANVSGTKYADYNDLWARGVDHTVEDCRVYKFKGYKFEIVVPESYAKQLDRVRELRAQANVSIFEHPEQVTDIVKARAELFQNPVKNRLLPEDIAHLAKEVPNPDRLNSVEMLDFDYYGDVILKQQGSNGRALATAAPDGGVRLYDSVAGKTKDIHVVVFHEWAHLAQFMGESYKSFEPAARCENDYFRRDYAKTNDMENWAVHFGEVILSPRAEDFADLCQKAPIRAMITGLSLKEELAKVPAGQKSPHHDQLVKRADYIEREIVPKAKESIEKLLDSQDPVKVKDALRLITSVRDDAHAPQTARRLVDMETIARLGSSENVEIKIALVEFLDKSSVDAVPGINSVEFKRSVGAEIERKLMEAPALEQEKILKDIEDCKLYERGIIDRIGLIHVLEHSQSEAAQQHALRLIEFGGRGFKASPDLIDVLTRVARKNPSSPVGHDCIQGLLFLESTDARVNFIDIAAQESRLNPYLLQTALAGIKDAQVSTEIFTRGLRRYEDPLMRLAAICEIFNNRRLNNKTALLDYLRETNDPNYSQVIEYIAESREPELKSYLQAHGAK